MITNGDQSVSCVAVTSAVSKRTEEMSSKNKKPVTAPVIPFHIGLARCASANFIPTPKQSQQKKNGAYTKNVSKLPGVDDE